MAKKNNITPELKEAIQAAMDHMIGFLGRYEKLPKNASPDEIANALDADCIDMMERANEAERYLNQGIWEYKNHCANRWSRKESKCRKLTKHI